MFSLGVLLFIMAFKVFPFMSAKDLTFKEFLNKDRFHKKMMRVKDYKDMAINERDKVM
jgi:hypothetical protein